MRQSVLVFVVLAVFASVVLAARKPEQKHPSSEGFKETKDEESTVEKVPVKKPLKKEPNAKKPNHSKKLPVPQKNEEEDFEEEAIMEEKPSAMNKKPSVSGIKNKNKKKPTANGIPQPPKRGEKQPAPIKEKPDVVDSDLSFELPRPPSPPNA